MAVYVVIRRNKFFPRGTFLKDSDPGFVQKTVMTKEGPSGWVGLMVPLHEVRPFTVKLQKHGLDFRKGGALG